MPAPLILVAIGSAISGIVGVEVFDVIKYRVKKNLDERWRDYLTAALDNLGIQIDPELGITDETLTKAINDNLLAGTGLELASLLDREKMLKGFEKLALKKVAGDFGFPEVETVGGVRTAVQKYLVETLGNEIAAEAGGVIDAATPSAALLKKITSTPVPAPNWNDPVDMSPAGIDNRLRQAKYRSRHSKYWVEK